MATEVDTSQGRVLGVPLETPAGRPFRQVDIPCDGSGPTAVLAGCHHTEDLLLLTEQPIQRKRANRRRRRGGLAVDGSGYGPQSPVIDTVHIDPLPH